MRTGVPARVREAFLSSGLVRVNTEWGNRVALTRMNSVTHQS